MKHVWSTEDTKAVRPPLLAKCKKKSHKKWDECIFQNNKAIHLRSAQKQNNRLQWIVTVGNCYWEVLSLHLQVVVPKPAWRPLADGPKQSLSLRLDMNIEMYWYTSELMSGQQSLSSYLHVIEPNAVPEASAECKKITWYNGVLQMFACCKCFWTCKHNRTQSCTLRIQVQPCRSKSFLEVGWHLLVTSAYGWIIGFWTWHQLLILGWICFISEEQVSKQRCFSVWKHMTHETKYAWLFCAGAAWLGTDVRGSWHSREIISTFANICWKFT